MPTSAGQLHRPRYHRLPGVLTADRRGGPRRGDVRRAVQARPDDLDQAILPVDDVPVRLGHQTGPVRVQWDPDRSLTLTPLTHRAIQIGLSGEAVSHYLDQWITSITDITPLAERIHRHISSGDHPAAQAEMPTEHVYPLPGAISTRIGASPA